MKKIVIILLIILPIFMIVSISFVGKIVERWKTISVEGISFVNDNGEDILQTKVGKGQNYQLKVKIRPSDATNQKVNYALVAGNVGTLNDNILTTHDYGTLKISAITEDGFYKAELLVQVVDESVESVSLSHHKLSLRVGESFTLVASVFPKTAVQRSVEFTSSNPSVVSVNASGVIVVLKESTEEETVIITVTTLDGGFTDTCEITVLADLPDVAFYRLDEDVPITSYEVLVVYLATVDLLEYVRFGNEDAEKGIISFVVINGSCSLDGHMLSLYQKGETVKIKVIVEYYRDGEFIRYENEGSFRLM